MLISNRCHPLKCPSRAQTYSQFPYCFSSKNKSLFCVAAVMIAFLFFCVFKLCSAFFPRFTHVVVSIAELQPDSLIKVRRVGWLCTWRTMIFSLIWRRRYLLRTQKQRWKPAQCCSLSRCSYRSLRR